MARISGTSTMNCRVLKGCVCVCVCIIQVGDFKQPKTPATEIHNSIETSTIITILCTKQYIKLNETPTFQTFYHLWNTFQKTQANNTSQPPPLVLKRVSPGALCLHKVVAETPLADHPLWRCLLVNLPPQNGVTGYTPNVS